MDISEENTEVTCQGGEDESNKEYDGGSLHRGIHFFREAGELHPHEHPKDNGDTQYQEDSAEHFKGVDGDRYQQRGMFCVEAPPECKIEGSHEEAQYGGDTCQAHRHGDIWFGDGWNKVRYIPSGTGWDQYHPQCYWVAWPDNQHQQIG